MPELGAGFHAGRFTQSTLLIGAVASTRSLSRFKQARSGIDNRRLQPAARSLYAKAATSGQCSINCAVTLRVIAKRFGVDPGTVQRNSRPFRFECRSSVSTWLMWIARHKALSARRRRTDAELDEKIEVTVADPRRRF